jgi:hypothetical protein
VATIKGGVKRILKLGDRLSADEPPLRFQHTDTAVLLDIQIHVFPLLPAKIFLYISRLGLLISNYNRINTPTSLVKQRFKQQQVPDEKPPRRRRS